MVLIVRNEPKFLNIWADTLKGYNISARGFTPGIMLLHHPAYPLPPALRAGGGQRALNHRLIISSPSSRARGEVEDQALLTEVRGGGIFCVYITQGETLGYDVSPRWGDSPYFRPLAHNT